MRRENAMPDTPAHRPMRRTYAQPAARPARRTPAGARSPRPQRGGAPTGGASQAGKPERKKSRYIPALDGLRALAVAAVIAYHMGMSWAPGGLLGVTVFFVLSGYLITSLLLIEWDSTGTVNLPQFWLRRVRRLFPAIVFVVVCTAVLCIIFDHSLFTKLRDDMWAALLWVSNWWYILRDVSYFDALGAPSPLTHFWSLAIEEQFYLVWPVALLLAHKLGVKRTHMRNATIALALLSALEMALLFDPAADPSRVYYGTDTRAFSLLIGAWLAFVWPSNQLGAENEVHLSREVRLALDAVGALALVGLVALMAFADGFSPFLYRGGILLASVLTAVVIAVIVHPASLLGRVAAFKPFVWVGLRSYGIYLWHYPLLLLMSPQGAIGETPWWLYLVEIAAILACSAFSYTFVEDPLRKGALGKFVKGVRSGTVVLSDWLRTHAVPAAAGAVLVLTCIGGIVFVPNTAAIEGADLLKDEEAHVAGIPQGVLDGDGAGEDGTVAEAPRLDVLMIGDSVSVRAIPSFTETFPFGAIDAAVNRQMSAGQEVYATYADQGIVGDVVVFALGTNGVVTDDQIDDLMAAVGSDKHVFFVNTRSPQAWVSTTNAALDAAAERYGNVSVIDWYGASASHGDWFDGDGTHLNEEGAQAYIGMVHDAVASLLPDHTKDDGTADDTPMETGIKKAGADAEGALRSLGRAIGGSLAVSQDQPKE